MYLWHILHTDSSELIWKIYQAQKCQSNRGDWFKILNDEKKKYGIEETDEEIGKLSKLKFKKIVEQQIKANAIKYLEDIAKTNSKSSNILNSKFEIREYFSDRRFSKEDVQLLFSLRTKMVEVKQNFKNQYENLNCRICKDKESVENEEYLLECEVLNKEKIKEIKFSDVNGDLEKQLAAVKVSFQENIEKKKSIFGPKLLRSQIFFFFPIFMMAQMCKCKLVQQIYD